MALLQRVQNQASAKMGKPQKRKPGGFLGQVSGTPQGQRAMDFFDSGRRQQGNSGQAPSGLVGMAGGAAGNSLGSGQQKGGLGQLIDKSKNQGGTPIGSALQGQVQASPSSRDVGSFLDRMRSGKTFGDSNSGGGGSNELGESFFQQQMTGQARSLALQSSSARRAGLGALEARGLGTSSVVGNLLQEINSTEQRGLQQAATDISGQRFANEQRGIDRRFQSDLSHQDFTQQAGLLRLKAQLANKKKKGGGVLGGLAKIAGGVLGSVLGPVGAAAGGALADKLFPGK